MAFREFGVFFQKNRLQILVFAIILAGFISYINVHGNRFVWDDVFLITENKFIESFEHLPDIFVTSSGGGVGRIDDFYRPMQQVSYSLVYMFENRAPWAYHFLNIVLHLGCAVLIFFLIKRIFRRESLAFLTSLLWVIHPIQTEAITYMSGTADPLSVIFALGSFWFYLNFRENKKWKELGFSCILFAFALLSKESIIIFPILLGLYEFVSTDKKWDWKQYVWVLPFLAMSAGYFALRLTVLNFGSTLSLFRGTALYSEHISVRLMTFAASLLSYYSFIFLPVGLHMERKFSLFLSVLSPPVLLSLALLVIFGYFVHKNLDKKNSPIVFGILWFFISFIPMSGIIPVNQLLLEHWLYLPSIGFFLLISLFIHKIWDTFPGYRHLLIAGMILVVVALSSLTLIQNTVWKDPITFYTNILKHNEGSTRIYNNLGMEYAHTGNLVIAERLYLKALEMSKNYPSSQVNHNLAALYATVGMFDKAIFYANRSVEANPTYFISYRLLGKIYENLGQNETAQKYYGKADSIKFYRNLV